MEFLGVELRQLLRELLTQLPSLLTLLICLVIAVVRWKRHPKVSLVASLAFVFLIFYGLFFSVVYTSLPRWLGYEAYEANRRLYFVLALVASFSFAIALATLLSAVFIDRRRTS